MVRMMTWAMAVKIPFPHAWKTLAAIIRGKLGAIMQNTSPIREMKSPERYSLRVGKAVSGIMIPMAREYPLVSHCPVVTLICRSERMAGRAVVSAVDSMDSAMQLITMLKKISVRLRSVSTVCLLIFFLHFYVMFIYFLQKPAELFFFFF